MGSDNTFGENNFNPDRKTDLEYILSEIKPFLKKSEIVPPISTAGKWKCTSDDKDLVLPAALDFGDYCTIEQHRFGCDNEHYIHKVIGRLKSNTWVEVPVMGTAKETHHNHMEDVVACVCCGVFERKILNYRLTDVRIKL